MERLPLLAALALLATPFAVHPQVTVRPAALESDRYAELAQVLQSDGILDEFAEFVNESVELPSPVGIRFAECGQVNAFYDPSQQLISMCFELVEHFVNVMSREYPGEDAALEAAEGAFSLVLFHELGHALVDVLELPITGREEDAVDQLSAWAMIDSGAGDEAVLNAALSYYRTAERGGGAFTQEQFADEHSLSLQRFYNFVCWVYGSDPAKYGEFVSNGTLPAARARRCPNEYAQLDRSWTRLLEAATQE